MRAVIQRVTSANVSVTKVLELPSGVLAASSGASQDHALVPSDRGGTDDAAPNSNDIGKEIVPVASTQVVQEIVGEIGRGLVVFIGVGREDSDADVSYMVDRTINLRIFPDPDGQMNLSLLDVEGEILVVSQFTLYGDARKGRRPSFFEAMDPTEANGFYMLYCKQLESNGLKVQTGRFGAEMKVSLINDGPVTILVDSKKGF